METPIKKQRSLYLQNIQKLCTPLHIPSSPFMKSLGYGTGVNVYRLERSPKSGKNLSPWAVKRVSKTARASKDDTFNTRIQIEANILRKLSHPNIVGFRGIVKAEDGVDSLALECCNASLGDILEERNDACLGPLEANKILKVIDNISRALDYLHTEANLLHGDLKSFNVLVKGDFEICKLCDFGVCLPLNEKGEINFAENRQLYYVGTMCWCAPEIMDDEDIIDSKADIFSFGLVIYETIALAPPHSLPLEGVEEDKENIENNTINDDEDSSIQDSLNNTAGKSLNSTENSYNKTEDSIESDEVDELQSRYGTRPPLPHVFELSDEYKIIVEIFYCCTNKLPEERPSAKTIWTSLLGKE